MIIIIWPENAERQGFMYILKYGHRRIERATCPILRFDLHWHESHSRGTNLYTILKNEGQWRWLKTTESCLGKECNDLLCAYHTIYFSHSSRLTLNCKGQSRWIRCIYIYTNKQVGTRRRIDRIISERSLYFSPNQAGLTSNYAFTGFSCNYLNRAVYLDCLEACPTMSNYFATTWSKVLACCWQCFATQKRSTWYDVLYNKIMYIDIFKSSVRNE